MKNEKEAKEKILEYIRTESISPDIHFSYCSYPFEDCCCNRKEITDTLQLMNGGYIDSLSLVDLVVFIEKEFDVKIHDTEINPSNFETVNHMIALIDRLKNE